MRSAIALLSVLALMSYAALATNIPYHVYRQGYESAREQVMEHNLDYSATWASPANIQILASPREVYEAPGTTNATVEVVYKSPSKGRIVVNLKNANEDILIHIDARFKWYSSINTLILNSKKADGGWQQEVRPEGFPFPCCGYITTIILQVEIGDSAFVISANGMEIASYPYRVGLEPPVDVIEYIPGESQASVRAQLQSISVYY